MLLHCSRCDVAGTDLHGRRVLIEQTATTVNVLRAVKNSDTDSRTLANLESNSHALGGKTF